MFRELGGMGSAPRSERLPEARAVRNAERKALDALNDYNRAIQIQPCSGDLRLAPRFALFRPSATPFVADASSDFVSSSSTSYRGTTAGPARCPTSAGSTI